MPYDRDKEIVETLLNDDTFGTFHDNGKFLQYGRCPNCNRKSVWVSKDKPGRIQCDHKTSCNPWFSVTPRELYPELFENYAERHPATEVDPKATARAYLEDRKFDTAKMADWYEQGYYPLKGGTTAPTVRIHLWDGFYWERLIDKKHVSQAGRKNNYKRGIKYAGRCWTPPNFELNDNDECIITEGIFNAWSFIHMKEPRKAIATLSSNNLPMEIIKKNSKRNIMWTFAFDSDKAGINAVREFVKKLRDIGEQCRVMLTASANKDWNDEWIAGKLDEYYLKDALWRGQLAIAGSARDKAFWLWVKRQRSYIQLEFGKALYSFKVDSKATQDVYEQMGVDSLQYLWINTDTAGDIAQAKNILSGYLSGNRFSNCVPKFLYVERDPLTQEQDYFFNVSFYNGNPTRLIALDGSAIKAPTNFADALLNKTSGGTFDGDTTDMKHLKENWFDHKTTEITRLRFVGYDMDSNSWVYPDFGFHNGRHIKMNDMGFIEAGQHKVKTKVGKSQVKMIHSDNLDESWIGHFEQAFGVNGLIIMAWWLCTLYAEQIRNTYQDWPFLEFTGDPGTGKTTLIKFMWRCCGRIDGYEGFDPAKSSIAGRSRTLERYSGLPCVVIEADRSDKGSRQSFDFNEFKDFYNGGIIRTTGVKNGGNETIEPTFRGGVLIAQNKTVETDDDAVMERIVHCHSTKAHHSRATKKIAQMMAAMKAETVAGWLHTALTSDKTFLENYNRYLKDIEQRFQDRPEIVRDRIIANHAKVAAGIWCLKLLFPNYMTKDKCHELENQLWAMAVTREKRLKADTELVERFWEYYEHLNSAEYEDSIQNTTVTAEKLNHSRTDDVIAINLVDFEQACAHHRLERLPINDLKKQLPLCVSHPYQERKNVNSQITGKSRFCWIFKKTAEK